MSSRPKQLSVPKPGELQRLLAAIHSQQQSPGINPQETLHDLQRLIDSRSWEGVKDDNGQPMTFRRALEEGWPIGVGLTQERRERLYALAEGYPECKDMLADVKRRIDKLLPLGEHGTNQYSGVDNINSTKGGTDEDYTRRRLARDHADLYEQVVTGELSANKAAIMAGFRRPTATVYVDTPEAAIEGLLRRFEKSELLKALKEAPDG